MIRRVVHLRNLGQFMSESPGKELAFERLTLVHSENGRGKTTLAAVFRSLAADDPRPIEERRRLDGDGPPKVVLQLGTDPSTAVYEDGAWSAPLDSISVFDDDFVDHNVYSGLAVAAEHRRNLHEVILGPHARAQGARLEVAVSAVEDCNRKLRELRPRLHQDIRGPYDLEEFCRLPRRDDLDEAIEEADRSLDAAMQKERVRAGPPPPYLEIPALDINDISVALRRDLPALDAATRDRVQAHLATLGARGEAWVAEGMEHMSVGHASEPRSDCPFCAQSLEESPVLDAYRDFFGEEYARLRDDIHEAIRTVQQAHGVDARHRLRLAADEAQRQIGFWAPIVRRELELPDVEGAVADWERACTDLLELLTRKADDPLAPLEVSEDLVLAIRALDVRRDELARYNESVTDFNVHIDAAKEQAAEADSEQLREEHARLLAHRRRFDPEIDEICQTYLRTIDDKAEAEEVREEIRGQVDHHRAESFPEYEGRVNHYLENLGASFRIEQVAPTNTRAGAGCVYDVVVAGNSIRIGGAEPGPGEPAFRTLLSSGDRNTLALAVFLASMDRDPNLAHRTVVIDDPKSSLDDHRAWVTCSEIVRLSRRARQVIVLSHDRRFLAQIWERSRTDELAAVSIGRDQAGSTLMHWDVAQEAESDHARRHARLDAYAKGAQDRRDEVGHEIRKYIEDVVRVKYPELLLAGEPLHKFVDRCRTKLGQPDEVLGSEAFGQLGDLNKFSRRFHHSGESEEGINEEELRVFVQRTLDFCRQEL